MVRDWFRIPALAFAFFGLLPAEAEAVATQTAGRARFSWEAVPDPIVSGYKVHWGQVSGTYTHCVDAGNVTEVVIAEFTEGVRYFSAVTAYAETGEESDYSTEISFVYESSDRIVFLEAEDGVLSAPMQVTSDGSLSWVAASAGDPAAADTLSFEVPYAADYYVWCRVLAPSTSADSMLVTVDQQAEEVYDVYGEPSPPAAAIQTCWIWSRIEAAPGVARAYALEGGSHTIRFRYCEDTCLDRIVIVGNPDFVPTDTLPCGGDFVEVVNQPQGGGVVEGGSMTLAATVIASGPLTMQWFHDGVAVPNASQMLLNLSEVQTTAGGTYTLLASRNSASATTLPVTVTVLPAAGSPGFQVRHMSIASGGQVTFEVTGAPAPELRVYVSSDLEHWSLLGTHTLSGDLLTFSDPGAKDALSRFYRLGTP